MLKKKSAKLLSFDAFAKTEEEVRIRTNTGGIITISCILVTLYLLLNEWSQFNSVITSPQLVVDRDRNLKLELNLDISFPNISCDLINLDIMDESGELQLDLLDSTFIKTRLDPQGNPLDNDNNVADTDADLVIGVDDLTKNGEKRLKEILAKDPDYCGSCYGSQDQTENESKSKDQKICCQTCNDVRDSYLNAGWAFFDGAQIEQCENEGYVAKINKHLEEGCRIKGQALLNRIQGNIHFAPGKSYSNYKAKGSTHRHDTSLYDKVKKMNFNHIIHHLSFGKSIDKVGKNDLKDYSDRKKFSINPLDDRKVIVKDFNPAFHQFSYYTKIVPTRYEFLDEKISSIETAQFSATYHSRPIQGGTDEDHPTTFHSRGGIPGLFFFFEMSPIKVINKEHHFRTWSSFLLNCITSIGSVLAVGTVFDKIFYRAQKTLKAKKSK
ncbi:endoplasmic reticulum-Golgi intermediate compartment family protein NDAI_0H01900 [Naumovozyma dairenensis CBS 421]|uniref:Endoplasmic reticulum-Golgi intermediate compartment protein n=1 Tax=Naumovozyma dairenensis (strain ATCC 10597 / BCRC 20456 / CBS 421 / NBRC 0211 / NRRL Y-12639) TaxID=1071378 RepID=G0WF03_NAUDC|nr:hypothetical protein NDAI_0H01900 [Naumovozyma dairenensis CBS 421]CCD26364.1 hypothetical protein NDAI_0H01900 [Naumovozyma dairenensis CBS 421]